MNASCEKRVGLGRKHCLGRLYIRKIFLFSKSDILYRAHLINDYTRGNNALDANVVSLRNELSSVRWDI